MASLKEIRRRIRSIGNTQKIFKAMETVAAAKLRRAQARAHAARPYSAKISEMLGHLSGAASELEHPLFKAREVRRTALVLVTADRGLCGAYNTNLIRAAEQRLAEAAPDSVALVCVGRKGRDHFARRRWPVLASYADLPAEASLDFARALTQDLIRRFTEGEVDRVEILFARFVNALTRRITFDPFLPVGADAPGTGGGDAGTIFEPGAEAIFAELLPRYATAKMFAALADALASEHSARMIAMGAARKNAGELLDGLVLQRNRARQAMITKELLEIVAGAEALK
uniref:ATP synthase gamma chain n=1 Tax=Eiseniibacteriota bacterium TaxID=2212470 RepID=A0A832HYL3_UNCEI